jgi:hypothetical protein
VDVVAALEASLIAVTKTIFERMEIDIDVDSLAVPRVLGICRVESVPLRLDVSQSRVHVLLKLRQVVAQLGYLAVTDAVGPDPGVYEKFLEAM